MKILEVLTYYRPWVSGLTIYVERLSRALVRQGHDVTVLTSQYDPNLPRYEVVDGVKVVRIPVAYRVSKGVLMPGFGPMAWKLAHRNDVIHLHLPQFDAPGVAMRGRLLGKPVVLTYHCDLQLPSGLFNRVVDRVVQAQNWMAGTLADAVVTYTRDYAMNTPYLSQYVERKLHIIPPPVELVESDDAEVSAFKEKHQLAGKSVIGLSTRIAAEKGIEVLLEALPIILKEHPEALVLHANPETIGENAYARRLEPLFQRHAAHYIQLGGLHGSELTVFYKSLDVLCVTSLNRTESFGLVQIEAMRNNVPVAACALPGVRQPVTMTGMGEVTPVGDSEALAQAVIAILNDKATYQRDAQLIADSFSPEQTAVTYATLFQSLQQGHTDTSTPEPAAYERLRQMRDERQ
ncbi:MAG: glycosyltransferase family 4 protein [Ardenticatenaceae bacterium]|nr:glycosyltransferase family 4 protein [Ardenticatenaceae bacterium]